MNSICAQTLRGSRRLLVMAVVLTLADHPLPAGQPAGSEWAPGTEVRVEDPEAGVDGYFLVYVPTDYNLQERWPVVFYYHGLGGRPDTNTIRRIADGKYCIVVGMSYYAPGMDGYRFLATKDVRILDHVLDVLRRHLNVNDKRLFLSGFSKGGFYTCDMLQYRGDLFAGAIILGAGSKSPNADYSKLAGKEVFIGCGEQDQFLAGAKVARERMAAAGATVTFERWPGLGHSVGDTAGLRRWIFEQTVDRPQVDPVPNNAGNRTDPQTSSPTAWDGSVSHRNEWIAGAALLAGIAIVVFVVSRRRAMSANATSQSRDEGRGA